MKYLSFQILKLEMQLVPITAESLCDTKKTNSYILHIIRVGFNESLNIHSSFVELWNSIYSWIHWVVKHLFSNDTNVRLWCPWLLNPFHSFVYQVVYSLIFQIAFLRNNLLVWDYLYNVWAPQVMNVHLIKK